MLVKEEIEFLQENAVRGKIRVALYARKSQKDKNETSIDVQLQIVRKMIDDIKNDTGLDVICEKDDVYTEDNKSGYKATNRNKFQELVNIVNKHPGYYTGCLVYKQDRFARNKRDATLYRDSFYKSKCLVLSTDYRNTFDAQGNFQLAILDALNQYYVENSATLVVNGMIESARRGRVLGTLPYGLKRDSKTKKVVINDVEAVNVRKMFELASAGINMNDIADIMKKAGVKNRSGEFFTDKGIKGILTNVKMIGTYVWANSNNISRKKIYMKNIPEIRIQNCFKAIIDKKTFDRVQYIISKAGETHQYRKNENGYFLSGNKIFCKHCGNVLIGERHMGGKNKQWKRYYVCPNHSNVETKRRKDKNGNIREKCECLNLNADYIERITANMLCNILNNGIAQKKDRIFNLSKNMVSDLKIEIDTTMETIKTGKSDIKKLIKLQLDDIGNATIYSEALKKITTEIEIARRNYEKLSAQYNTIINSMANAIESSEITVELLMNDRVLFRRLIDAIIDRVEVSKDNVEIILKH